MTEIYGIEPNNGKKKIYSLVINKPMTKTKAIEELYNHLKLIDIYKNFNDDLIRSCCIKYVSALKDKHLENITEWYYLYFAICLKQCKILINQKIIESRIKIRNFITNHIWNLKYDIGRKMFDLRAEQEGIVFKN